MEEYMKKYIALFSFSMACLQAEDSISYAKTVTQMYHEAVEFLENVAHVTFIKENDPFIDPTKPQDKQSAWCKECSALLKYKPESVDYTYTCINPLQTVWENTAMSIAKQNPQALKHIPNNHISVTVLKNHFPNLIARFACIGMIQIKK